jgi:hypothetical protein
MEGCLRKRECPNYDIGFMEMPEQAIIRRKLFKIVIIIVFLKMKLNKFMKALKWSHAFKHEAMLVYLKRKSTNH